MRRKEKEVSDRKVISDLIATAQVCRLAMVDNGAPYVVPVNYGYRDNALYVHSAGAGRKIDILKRDNRVCFEIESAAEIIKGVQPCLWSARCRSLIGYGRVEFITDAEEKRRGPDAIMAHYGKTGPNAYNEKQLGAIVLLKIAIKSIACKELGDWG